MNQAHTKHIRKYIDERFESSVIPSLQEYISIDNLSRIFDPEWNTNGKLEKAAEHIKQWVIQLDIRGLKCEVIKDEGYSPLIFTEIDGDLPYTLFFYGHFDKQPPFTGWMEGLTATTPKIIDGKLYGRGGADDGYSTYSTMLALKALQQQKIKLPRCVMVTEGDEQSGGGHMDHYLFKLKQRIGSPFAFFCLDTGTIDYERLWVSTSLRGDIVAKMRVTANKQGLHCGTYSGVFPSCYRIARQLISRLEDPQTGQIHPNFHTTIPPARYKEMEELAQQLGAKVYQFFPFVGETQPISKNPLNCLIQRNWNPSVTVTGLSGIPSIEQAGNILHPSIDLKLSIRLPPTFPVEKAEQTLKDILLKDTPYGAEVQLLDMHASTGWSSNQYKPYFEQAIRQASEQFYGKNVLSMGDGGTIPLIGVLEKMWPGRQFLITGVLGPDSNAHGPNEFLHIDYAKKLTCCLAYVVGKCSEHLTVSSPLAFQ